ncbi:MAG: DUF1385 domain-containing protein [Acidobacteriota bacterium]
MPGRTGSFRRWLRASLPLLAEGSVLVGGQAVIEGVLMRLPETYAVAVRDAKGEVRVKRERLPETARGRFGNLPLVRGSIILFKAMMLGISALNFSAEVAMEESGEEEGEKGKGGSAWPMALTVALSLAAGVAIFFYVPLLLTQLLTRVWPLANHSVGFNLIDGAIRIVMFVLYILGISLMKDIRRVFGYHGAEHKVVYTWEAREELTVENARRHSTLHPRCGTSFLLFVMVVAILVFSLVPSSAPFWVKLLSRVVFLPVIAGISYELIRFTAKFPRSPFVRPLLWPGLGMQLLTTRVPDDTMLEVAIRALKEAQELGQASLAA